MLGKFKHTNKCNDCGSLFQNDAYEENRTCLKCGGKLKYIGLQPSNDNITNMTLGLSEWFKNNSDSHKNEYPIINTQQINNEPDNDLGKVIKLKNGVTIKECTPKEIEEYEKQLTINMETKNISIEEVKTDNVELKIEDVIDTSGRVTNAQVIPALKTAITERSREKIILIRKTYPDVYDSSLKYLGKKNLKVLEELI